MDILFKESHDNGTTFSNPINLNNFTNETSLIDFNANPQVGAFGKDVYVIWHGKLSSVAMLIYSISRVQMVEGLFENATNVNETNDKIKTLM